MVFRTFWPSFILVIGLEKLWDWSLGPMTLFQRPIIVSIRLRRLSPFRTIQDRESALKQAPAADWTKDGGRAPGRGLGGWNTCGNILLSPPLRSAWRGDNRVKPILS